MKRMFAWTFTPVLLLCLSIPAIAGELLHAEGHTFRWGTGNQSEPQTITYALLAGSFTVPGGKSIVSPGNCGSMHDFPDIVSASSHIEPAAAEEQLNAALSAWQAAAAIRFVKVLDPNKADIVIGAADHASGRAFANLSYRNGRTGQPVAKALGKSDAHEQAALPGPVDEALETPVEIEQAYVCLNPGVPWKIGFDGNLQIYDLRFTFIHEIGHAIGLDHPGKSGAVMGYRYDETVGELQSSDIAAIRSLYGPNPSPIKTSE